MRTRDEVIAEAMRRLRREPWYRGVCTDNARVDQLIRERAALRATLVCLVADGDRIFGPGYWPDAFQPALSTARALLAKEPK